jgi:hypothetical protein
MIDHRPLKHGKFGHLPAKVPCNECPLSRKSKPMFLGGYTPAQYLEVLHGIADLACHLSKGFDVQNPEAQRSCTGVAMYRANTGVAMLADNSRAAMEHVGPNTKLVFASPIEFVSHHNIPNAALSKAALHAKQGVADARFAKDQCEEIVAICQQVADGEFKPD